MLNNVSIIVIAKNTNLENNSDVVNILNIVNILVRNFRKLYSFSFLAEVKYIQPNT